MSSNVTCLLVPGRLRNSQKLLIYWDFKTQASLGFIQNGVECPQFFSLFQLLLWHHLIYSLTAKTPSSYLVCEVFTRKTTYCKLSKVYHKHLWSSCWKRLTGLNWIVTFLMVQPILFNCWTGNKKLSSQTCMKNWCNCVWMVPNGFTCTSIEENIPIYIYVYCSNCFLTSRQSQCASLGMYICEIFALAVNTERALLA